MSVIQLKTLTPKKLSDFKIDPIEWSKEVLGQQPNFDYVKKNKEPSLKFMATIKPYEIGSMCLLSKLFKSLTYFCRDDEWLEENYEKLFESKLPNGHFNFEETKKFAQENYLTYFPTQTLKFYSSDPGNDFDDNVEIVRVNCQNFFLYWVFIEDKLVSVNFASKAQDEFVLRPDQIQINWRLSVESASKSSGKDLRSCFKPSQWDGRYFHGKVSATIDVKIVPSFNDVVFQQPSLSKFEDSMEQFKKQMKKGEMI